MLLSYYSDAIQMKPWKMLFLIAGVGLLALVPGNNVIPLIDRDEPRFAQATVEMIERGDWIIPYFNGDYRFDKPVLTYWLMRGSYALFGINEFGARFHSVACAIAVALVLFLVGKRRFSAQAGLASALAWLTCFQLQVHGRAAVADLPMVLCVTLVMAALLDIAESRFVVTGWRFWALYGGLGFGFLAKGPIALLVPLLALLVWRWWFWRKPVSWGNLNLGVGLIVSLGIAGAWGLPALIQTHGLFWKTGIGEHVVERGVKSFNARIFLPIYYPLTALVSLLPWTFFARSAWRGAREPQPLNRLLAAWFVAPFLIFTFYATQLPHYILPGFPAFFLLLGPAWDRLWKRRAALAIAIVMAVVGINGVGFWLRAHTPAIALSPTFAELPAGTAFGFYRYREPSLVFYSHRRWETLHDPADVARFAHEAGPRVVVMLEKDRKNDYADEIDSIDWKDFEQRRVSGWNTARSQPVTIRVLIRRS